MAYISQEKKAKLAPAIKAVLKKYGVKGTLAIRNHSTLVLNIKAGAIDFISNYNDVLLHRSFHGQKPNKVVDHIDVNPYWYKEHFTGKALDFFNEIHAIMNDGNHNNSDMMTDYHDVGWCIDVNVGQWDKPYVVEK